MRHVQAWNKTRNMALSDDSQISITFRSVWGAYSRPAFQMEVRRMTMDNPKQARHRAEAIFKKEIARMEDQKGMAEYLAEQRATQEKTARLRKLRLARDQAASSKQRSASIR